MSGCPDIEVSQTSTWSMMHRIRKAMKDDNSLLSGIVEMDEFLGCLSVAEVMDNLYGKEVRIITAISAIFWNIGGIAVQFKVFGSILNYFLGIPTEYSIIITALVVIYFRVRL